MFPDRLKFLRNNKRKTQQEMAEFLGMTRQGYAKYENGQGEADFDTLKRLANYFEVTTDYLTGNSNDPKLTEESLERIINDPELRHWHKELPKSDEEDLRRLKRIWEAYRDDE